MDLFKTCSFIFKDFYTSHFIHNVTLKYGSCFHQIRNVRYVKYNIMSVTYCFLNNIEVIWTVINKHAFECSCMVYKILTQFRLKSNVIMRGVSVWWNFCEKMSHCWTQSCYCVFYTGSFIIYRLIKRKK